MCDGKKSSFRHGRELRAHLLRNSKTGQRPLWSRIRARQAKFRKIGPLIQTIILQGKDVNRAFVRRTAQPFIWHRKVDAIQSGLIRSSTKFNQHLSFGRIPNTDQSAFLTSRGYHRTLQNTSIQRPPLNKKAPNRPVDWWLSTIIDFYGR